MTKLIPYLFFSGICREAIAFYQKCFGGNLEVMAYGDQDHTCPEAMKSQVMHAALRDGDLVLFASDSPLGETTQGTNVQINAGFDSVAGIDATFKTLSDGGKIISPLENAFWGDRFGVLKDRYGVQWMLTAPLK